jgi:hypothetical protein
MTHAPSKRPRITMGMRAIADPRGASLARDWTDALQRFHGMTRR